MIPTTFGSGSEVTGISVLKVNGKKKSFHDDSQIANIAIVDSYFIEDSPIEIIRNSAIDATAQCSEGFDSKSGNSFTKFLCNHAFNLLEEGIMKMDKEKIVMGSLISGLGFGNCSTTLGHALSYVFSNEGYSHGHALAFTTTSLLSAPAPAPAPALLPAGLIASIAPAIPPILFAVVSASLTLCVFL